MNEIERLDVISRAKYTVKSDNTAALGLERCANDTTRLFYYTKHRRLGVINSDGRGDTTIKVISKPYWSTSQISKYGSKLLWTGFDTTDSTHIQTHIFEYDLKFSTLRILNKTVTLNNGSKYTIEPRFIMRIISNISYDEPVAIEGCPENIVAVIDDNATNTVNTSSVNWTEPVLNSFSSCPIMDFKGPGSNGGDYPIGVTEVSYQARDAAGNTDRCSFKVTVRKAQEPCSDPCMNGGTCVEGTCICREGFGGTACEEKLTSVTCDSDSMTVIISNDLFVGIGPEDVYFRDSSCSTTSSTLTHMTLSTNYDECRTTRTENATTITFSNVIAYKLEPIPGTDITRENQRQIEISCSLDKTSQVGQSFKPMVGEIKFSDKGSGHFQLYMTRFKNESFDEPEDTHAEVWLNQALYFEVKLDSVEEVGMFIERCWATAGQEHDSTPSYHLFTDRCPSNIDGTVQVFFPNETDREGFKFDAFAFVGRLDMVYVHCQVRVCMDEEAHVYRECSSTSDLGRKRRSSSFLSTQTISSAPIRVRRSTNNMATNDLSAYNSFGMFLIGMVATVVAVATLMGVVKLIGRSTDISYKRVQTASMEEM
ncbi:uromodulin-like [Lytechinus variegatus]|uniref:uromodulin-like n=1 Tax=Lytechinus variegatus TaxID=7654 RepID=UPI001BB29E14|nr:uromodulin-like [Lytechinus variegatus]